MKLYFTFLIVFFLQQINYSQVYDVTRFGAIPDGITLNTMAIQRAIDTAHANGGGRVLIPKGNFLTGSIRLKTGVELYLSKKSKLLGSTNPADYVKLNRWKALIMADASTNISVVGKGVIDGQGLSLALHIDSLFYVGEIDSSDYIFPEKRPMVTLRPQIIEFVKCSNIKVKGVTIRNCASWVQSYDLCTNLFIDDIYVDSDTYWNNDGIDILDCENVRITNSTINSSDDGICLKSYNLAQDTSTYCNRIYIANCEIRSSASAIKFGTASRGGFKNIHIEKIKVFDTFRSAVALECDGGGILENILIDGVKAKNTGNALFIRLGKRLDYRPPGTIRNVTIRNMNVVIPFGRPDTDYKIRGPELPFFHNTFPASITGIPGHTVNDITLEGIKISYPGRGNKGLAYVPLSRINKIPEQIAAYPEFSMFGELPAWGFYVRHVNGLKMKDIKIKVRKPDYRKALLFDDVENVYLEAIKIRSHDLGDAIHWKNQRNIKIVN
ncbi:MAG: glycoside hydrolase family 28 protein [Crocinitomicaceae bacterium]|nr:glycoside hydrolase family 28 protein [Crocinitomicaceae bacterium]